MRSSAGTEEERGIDPEDVESLEPILQPFDPSKIKVDREPMTVFQAMRKISMGEIKLDPEFQRNLVWDPIRQSRLVESILLKIPLPAFYIDAVEPDQWVVVDGLQRLSTLDAFLNKKSLVLTGLEFLGTQFAGKNFDSLPRSSRRDIEETQLTLYIIRPETPPKVKFTIFYRINTGGLVLTPQEIRHATFPGRAPKFLKQLAESPQFLRATGSSVSQKRMDDRELVLRHLAFRITGFGQYKPDLNDFLGGAMTAVNQGSDEVLELLTNDFYDAMDLCYELLGRYAFRKFYRPGGSRGPINKALFETWSTAVLDFPRADLLGAAKSILDGLEVALSRDYEYEKSLSASTGGVNAVLRRFRGAYKIIEQALGV